MSVLYNASSLVTFARALLEKSGLDMDKAQTVAEILVEGDLLGHQTHGLQLLPLYLNDLEKGGMTKVGEPRVIADFPAAITWDGMNLPGPWLAVRAIDLAMARAKINGACTVVIRRSHHLACLAAYLKRVADLGYFIILTCSNPTLRSVAPHGGRRAIMTPNPFAAAWPTGGDPVILDISMSITTNGLSNRLRKEGKTFPGPWAVDNTGQISNDPAVLFAEPPGALLPIGGADHGHKGYALGLFVETLTSGLAGHGRADPNEGWNSTTSVCIQVFAPALFGGEENFLRQTEFLAKVCRENPPRVDFDRVRLPGESGLRRRAAQLAHGVELYPSIMPALAPWAAKLSVPVPAAN